MNQKIKKHIVKSMAVLISATALLTNTNLLTAYAVSPTKNSQNESTDKPQTKRPHSETTDESQTKRPRNETTINQPINQENLNNQLLNAAANGYTETVKALINHVKNNNQENPDAVKNYINAKDKFGATALIVAAYNGHTKTVALLINNGADINAKGNNGENALIAATCNGHTETLEALINHVKNNNQENPDAVKNYINAKDKFGATALIVAAYNGHTKTVALLINNGADINAENDNGNRPLHIASERNNLEICRLLLEHGADINAENDDHDMPFNLATNEEVRNLLRPAPEHHDFCNQEGFHNYCRENNITESECTICYDTKPVNELMCIYDCRKTDNTPFYEHVICTQCIHDMEESRALPDLYPTCREPLSAPDANR